MLKLTFPPASLSPGRAAVFRQGRQSMGWSLADLAQTLLVSEHTVAQWEAGQRPIPPKVLAWVEMYARSDVTPSEAVFDLAA